MTKKKIKLKPKNFILELIKQQVKPALGCTEIGIVALAAAKAAKMLPNRFASANVKISTCIYRNDIRVGVPKLGICGISTIAAAGFILKNPEKKLSCIDDLNSKNIPLVKKLGSSKKITIKIDYSAESVYTYVEAMDIKRNVAKVLIAGAHDHIVSAKLNGKETIKSSNKKSAISSDINFDEHVNDMSLEQVYNCIKKMTISDLKFLDANIKMNNKICNFGLKHYERGSLTEALLKADKAKNKHCGFLKSQWINKVILHTCAGVEARMYGNNYPVMTSANSGDHGLTVSIPLSVYAKINKISNLKLFQALLFAHYVTWYIKSHVGHLCGMCGCAVAAAPGAVCGIAYQLGWSWKKINDLLNAHLCSQLGIMCDGAKPSCAYKCINAILNGYLALTIVEHNGKILSKDGVVYKDVDKTIKNYKFISRKTLKSLADTAVQMLDNMQKLHD